MKMNSTILLENSLQMDSVFNENMGFQDTVKMRSEGFLFGWWFQDWCWMAADASTWRLSGPVST